MSIIKGMLGDNKTLGLKHVKASDDLSKGTQPIAKRRFEGVLTPAQHKPSNEQLELDRKSIEAALAKGEQPFYKKCTKCLQVKYMDEYYPEASSADGKARQCKTCRVDYQKAWNKKKLRAKQAIEQSEQDQIAAVLQAQGIETDVKHYGARKRKFKALRTPPKTRAPKEIAKKLGYSPIKLLEVPDGEQGEQG